ncbi:MAG: EamA family transporter [Verrucomicrobia bacterium]|jgi:drug/metabolite transporter (DMT)-like permease|nr:EamA family transporter [Verrucomicrobiota bacterium]
MPYLFLVSLLWGFSFGLIDAEFGQLSGSTLAAARLLLALPCFLPFLHYKTARPVLPQLLLIGAVQYGVMYITLFRAFAFLEGYEVAVLTVFTPLYVILAEALLSRRPLPVRFWMVAVVAVAGTLLILLRGSFSAKLPGILLMQVSNLCFAFGQIAYRRLRLRHPALRDHRIYALPFAGAAMTALIFALAGPAAPLHELARLETGQILSLLYLGTVASGLGFFLWNAGAVRVNPASLAVFNNLKIPLAILLSLLVFREPARLETLIPGTLLLFATLLYAEMGCRKPD